MIRRFNYTGRRKIPRSRVRIRVRDERDGRRTFDAELNLGDMELPEEAAVYVEAYHRSAYRRFDHGTVGHLVPTVDRELAGIPVRSPLFRVKVVQRNEDVARILAAADKVVPEDVDQEQQGRLSLLPVEYLDLRHRVWTLDLESDWPRLHLNRRIEGIREAARSGPEFVTLVYPEIFRAILARILQEGHTDPDLDDEDWPTLWLRFACRELGRPGPPADDATAAEDWIEEAVDAFSARARAAEQFGRRIAGRGE